MEDRNDVPPTPRAATAALAAALTIGLVLCYRIVEPFIPALVWSLTLAVLLARVEASFRRKMRSPTVAVLLTVLFAALLIVAPVVLVSSALVNEAVASAQLLTDLSIQDHWQALARDHGWLSPTVAWIERHFDLDEVLQTIAAQLGGWSASLLEGSVTGVINLLLTFYFLFYFLRDRTRFLTATARMLPLTPDEFRMLVERVDGTVFASVYGTIAVAALQGFLSGLMFWWLGLPSPVFWGILMGLLAVVPFLGAFIVWVPFAIGLALNGELFSALVLVVWGTLVVGLIDNVIYPVLVGRQLAMHSLLSFIAIVGGLILFGAHGIVLGPLIVALSFGLLEIWNQRSAGNLDREERVPLA